MPLSIEARLYYFACDFLWFVFSSFEYMTDRIYSTELDQLQETWAPACADVAHWVLREKGFVAKNAQLTESEAEKLYSMSGTRGDALMYRWSDTVRSAALSVHTAFPSIDEGIWIYYYYCRWLWKTLVEFDRLLRDRTFFSTEFHDRYRRNIARFEELAMLVGNERPGLDESISEKAAESINADIENRAAQLAIEWREAVLSASHDYTL